MNSQTILHVDDDAGVRALSAERLGNAGIGTIEVTADTDEALSRLAAGDVDGLVSDSLWTEDGERFVVAARRVAPALPIVVFTGKDWSAVGADAEAAGASGFVRKGGQGFDALEDVLRSAVADTRPSGIVLARHDWQTGDELVTTVVTAIATLRGTAPTQLPSLYGRIDFEALERFLRSVPDGSAVVPLRLLVPASVSGVDDTSLVFTGDGTVSLRAN
jgi:DNA-binding NtrC family response regulator